MSTTRNDLALSFPAPLPPAMPPAGAESMLAAAMQGFQVLRRRWQCLGPACLGRERRRAWRPARIGLQDGWCCGPECFQAAVETRVTAELHGQAAPRRRRSHRVPLGLLLLSRGTIDHGQLKRALEMQTSYGGGRIGEWLMRDRAIDQEDIAAGVGLQWARPTFRLAQSQSWRLCRGWVPLSILETQRLLPLHFAPARRKLYVGFTQNVDPTALAALARIFECKTESCIVTDAALDGALEQLRALPAYDHVQDIGFDHLDDPAEIAGIVRQYAQFIEARQTRVETVGPFLWVRLRGQKIVHLTFKGK